MPMSSDVRKGLVFAIAFWLVAGMVLVGVAGYVISESVEHFTR